MTDEKATIEMVEQLEEQGFLIFWPTKSSKKQIRCVVDYLGLQGYSSFDDDDEILEYASGLDGYSQKYKEELERIKEEIEKAKYERKLGRRNYAIELLENL